MNFQRQPYHQAYEEPKLLAEGALSRKTTVNERIMGGGKDGP
ncbi:hypothetical protein [Halobacillus seohaensis]